MEIEMNQDIIKMAREAGDVLNAEWLERFFHMAQADMKEKCAKVCDTTAKSYGDYYGESARDAAAGTPTNGMFCYNTATGNIEVYVSDAWKSVDVSAIV